MLNGADGKVPAVPLDDAAPPAAPVVLAVKVEPPEMATDEFDAAPPTVTVMEVPPVTAVFPCNT
jgi:hypothetical protein